ncbi:MAG: N-acetylglucosamine-6-phosphate deacetylase [Ignavibacteriales bacterium]|nr:N-acetylglucosamine-6-phosphate deacetylase [Ignavibacteriales bacterium]MCB9208763.1 N-acetylglucosamine-6-phosphate deacetylase [Ignavibacteriales bacterium]MCB9218319.1 N-acetylglucosamine-6-phosphate deacetylase [Ignavibacteriales bacterium]MCB9260615.1 N-acetylglucosamine-6-phosphate deacetylase [Ignavibacteriales bacterium]
MNKFKTTQTAFELEGLFYKNDSPVKVHIKDEIITKIQFLKKKPANDNLYIAPGLLDLQVNGYKGTDFGNHNLSINEIERSVKNLWKTGVTTFLPTVITNKKEYIVKSLSVLAESLNNPFVKKSIPGFHLEGPFISPQKGYRGAHLKKYIKLPSWKEFLEYQNAAKGNINLITLSPELKGVVPFIRKVVNTGVKVSIAHHNATSKQIHNAVKAGAKLSTHLGNGCANVIHRHNNPYWPQLANDELSISVIADNYHLTDDEIKTFYKVKGNDKSILISDMLDLAGMEPGIYLRGERKIKLERGGIRFPEENVLAGAVATLSEGVANIMNITNCSLNEAINMASKNPANLLELYSVGEIEVGKRADLIMFKIEKSKIKIHKTYLAGQLVFLKK